MRRFRLFAIGLSIAVTLSLAAGCTGGSRPQTGRVTFQNGEVTLAGNLFVPVGEGPFPAVVIIHGSGKETARDLVLHSWFFVQHGFVVLTYDKRGVGESSGSYQRVVPKNSEAVLGELAGDALAGVEFLKNHNKIDPNRIGLFGLSQGGWIAPLAAYVALMMDKYPPFRLGD